MSAATPSVGVFLAAVAVGIILEASFLAPFEEEARSLAAARLHECGAWVPPDTATWGSKLQAPAVGERTSLPDPTSLPPPFAARSPYSCSMLRRRGRAHYPLRQLASLVLQRRPYELPPFSPAPGNAADAKEGGDAAATSPAGSRAPASFEETFFGLLSTPLEVIAPPPLPHTLPASADCLRALVTDVDTTLPITRRLLPYATGLALAASTGLLHIHRSLDGERDGKREPFGGASRGGVSDAPVVDLLAALGGAQIPDGTEDEAVAGERARRQKARGEGQGPAFEWRVESVAEDGAPQEGWDAALGLAAGERTLNRADPLMVTIARDASRVVVDAWEGVKQVEEVFELSYENSLAQLITRLGDPSSAPGAKTCSSNLVVFPGTARGWGYDVSFHARLLLSYKFEMERARRRSAQSRSSRGRGSGSGGAAAAPQDPPLLWAREEPLTGTKWSAGIIVVAVHVRWAPTSLTADEVGRDWTGFLWDDPRRMLREERDREGNGQSWWLPTPEDVQARIVRETVIRELRESGVRSTISVHVFSQRPDAASFPSLAALHSPEVDGVRVTFHLGPGEGKGGAGGGAGVGVWSTLYHLTQADFLVGSESLLSYWASNLASRPLVLAQQDSDRFQLCGEGMACCRRDGRCTFAGMLRVREEARRFAAMEHCGLLLRPHGAAAAAGGCKDGVEED